MKKPVAVFLFLFILVIIIILFGRKKDWSTKTALKHMEKSPLYHKLHKISDMTDDKLAEVFLEKGNYAWGGYEAILFIEKQNEVNFYSYIFYHKGFEFCESVIPKDDFTCFFDKLVEKGIWKLHNRLYNPFVDPIVDDGPTYFLKVLSRNKEKRVTVYSPHFLKGAKAHWDIIKVIEEFCLKSIEKTGGTGCH